MRLFAPFGEGAVEDVIRTGVRAASVLIRCPASDRRVDARPPTHQLHDGRLSSRAVRTPEAAAICLYISLNSARMARMSALGSSVAWKLYAGGAGWPAAFRPLITFVWIAMCSGAPSGHSLKRARSGKVYYHRAR